jgi:hypothetical protein
VSYWNLAQIFLDIVGCLALVVMWSRFRRESHNDARLSLGLQLLQSKIAVLEDLSDRSEVQVKQLNALLEKKVREVQKAIQSADLITRKIEQSAHKSMEVAKIFQDKIPHEEIIERKNTIKYVQAARLAHQGLSPEEIAGKVDLPMGEIEFIAKVNREELMFSEKLLPEWATEKKEGTGTEEDWAMQGLASPEESAAPSAEFSHVFEVPKADLSSLNKLGEEFRQACAAHEQNSAKSSLISKAEAKSPINPKGGMTANPEPAKEAAVKKFEFPKIGVSKSIDLTKNLG